MKKLTIFYLEGCPYCVHARRALRELTAESPDFAAVEVEWIDERARPDLAERYDYYYVPSIFAGGTKLYEARPSHGYETIRENLRQALAAAAKGDDA